MTDRQVAEFDSSFPLSLTRNGPADVKGSTNFVLSILSNDTDDVNFNLWILDSGKEDCVGIPGNVTHKST